MKIQKMNIRLMVALWCFIVAVCVNAQVSVTGTVTDNTGDGLPGVTVRLVSNPSVGTSTDLDGNFALSVPDLNQSLEFTYIGYQKLTVALAGKSNISVKLNEDAEILDEVVVVGYGVQKKVSLTGSVSTVSGKDLVKAPMPSMSNMLTGKVSGVTAVQSTGLPGADNAAIHVRGMNDFAGSGPLVIIDGVPADMNSINPQDVESVSVLKDAAAAIYGVQGANGVILITTKKGTEGNAKISYTGSVTWTRNTAMPEYLNAEEYMYWHNTARAMDGLAPLFDADFQKKVLTGNSDPTSPFGDTNWIDQTFRTAMMQNHNISASGGSEKTHYYVSAGIMDQEGTMRHTDYRRYNLRSNLDITVAKNMRFTSNISGFRTERTWPGLNITNQQDEFNPARHAITALPILKSEYNGYPLAYKASSLQANPIHLLENSGYTNLVSNQISASGQLEYDFKDVHPVLDGLRISVWGNYVYSHTLTSNFSNNPQNYVIDNSFGEPVLNYTPGFGENNGFFRGSSWGSNWIFRPQVSYNHKFGKADIGALYLYEATKHTGGVFQASSKDYISDDPVDISLGTVIPTSVSGSHQNTSVVSHVGRFNFAWDDKYLAEFAFRCDASYKYAPENRWGFFPSASAGWVISREGFMKNVHWLDLLKLRASYGESGKDNLDAFLYNMLFTPVPNATIMNGTPLTLYYTNSYLVRNLKWSNTRTYNIGVDIDVLQRKLGAEIDVFYQHTNNLLESISGSFPSSLGGNVPSMENSGAMANRGIDIVLKHNLTVNKDFHYTLRGTFSFARNKMLKMKTNDDHPNFRSSLGQPMGARYGLIATGLFQTQEQLDNAPAPPSGSIRLGDIMYLDTNGDGKISYKGTESDYVKIGYGAFPEITFAMNMDFYYKNFNLNLLWQGVGHVDYTLNGAWGNGHTDNTPYTMPFYGDGNAPKYLVEDAWTPENTDARYPRLSTVVNGNNAVSSTWWLINGEYLRLKNLQFGYDVPENVLRKTPFSRFYVYVAGTNVLTFSHFKYVDPESPSVSAGHYPQPSTWSLGLNVSF
ncbi:MAG: TonB-dependent receptor [Muribaculaceae bacterium]|nr:TonB-dependent receptor [Muribaculaceae bacterium]